jgi:arylsulfate sulfotransferase
MIAGKFLPLICFLTLVPRLAGFPLSMSSSKPMPAAPAVSPQAAYISSGQSMQFTATVAHGRHGVIWTVNTAGSSAPSGTIDPEGNFTAPTITENTTITVTATSAKHPSVSASATVFVIPPASVAATANPQVALYTISVPDGLSAFIQFSADTSYGLSTWSVAAPSGGGPVPILVAGMTGNTAYHMRAVFHPTGATNAVFTDSDHTFTTASYPAANLPGVTASAAHGQTPQPGVELLDLLSTNVGNKLNAVVTDLAGNVLWAYDPGSSIAPGTVPNPVKLLANGNFLVNFSSPTYDGQGSVIQEVDLTGHIVWQMTAAELNAVLATATCAGCNINVVGTHHDFAVLPNGHLVVLAATQQTISSNVVTGDVVIDLDQNHNPVWLWNEFDHLDVNRHPMSWPDWTHTNAVVYSPDDKALMISVRHQSWVIKINYMDGAGDGSILWKLGYQGDFNLLPGTTNAISPVDWFNAQHETNIIGATTAGTLDVLLFDNGDQRVLNTSGTLCGSTTTPCDSRVPILHLDESAKTVDITWIDKLAPLSSPFGGSARLLQNGNIEFDECAATLPPNNNAAIFEVTKTTPPVTVWSMQIAGQYAYRGIRIPSLYPGVQW